MSAVSGKQRSIRSIGRIALIAGASVLGMFAVIGAWSFFYYDGRVLPAVFIGDIPMGGLSKYEARRFLEDRLAAMEMNGIALAFDSLSGERVTLRPATIAADAAIPFISVDAERTAEWLTGYGKGNSVVSRVFSPFVASFQRPHLAIPFVSADEAGLRAALEALARNRETAPRDASVRISSVEPFAYEVIPERSGIVYDRDSVIAGITAAWSRLSAPEMVLSRQPVLPRISSAAVTEASANLSQIFSAEPFSIYADDPITGARRSWIIPHGRLAEWVVPVASSQGPAFWGVNRTVARDYLRQIIAPAIAVEPHDAKFRVDESGKVVEFQGSRVGFGIDEGVTLDRLDDAIARRVRKEGEPEAVELALVKIPPRLSTGDANTLGISEVLGAGTSDFSGSPRNRVKNILVAAKKLNGTLIAPGEIFSALKYLGPFTAEAGYVPELVIKGGGLEPEIGGGLCQIGTTLFRMAMNGALPIVERKSHSLVVRYYSDPRNGLPGTDATMYDPAPDFRFENDTGRAVLLQTDVDASKQRLVFTLWGTGDGRKGSFTPPKVSRWIPFDEEVVRTETDKLPPGEENCQPAFRGAESSFAYVREFPDGRREERVFTSFYRPLPKTCLVGRAAASTSTLAGTF